MFIHRLEELMTEKKITEYKLTQELNLSKSAVWNWKQGSQPTADKVVKIADFFEVTADYLLGRSDELGIVNSNADLHNDERELLSLYRNLNQFQKETIVEMLKGISTQKQTKPNWK